ncbi:hypothetical protein JCM17846_11210 [Iodidimonas nitroreducens]|uniref:Uncharacterized protein n=1 Tax=Iodidimonas nitroreducens TaxID=1236968 RepID=A0A5A7N8Q5_9PROT|nr:hypothetical protein JCM17846_11210 [Iodidimonas nitroreducens]
MHRGKPDTGPILGTAQHGSGIGAMGGDLAAILKHDIGQKAFIAPDQPRRDQGIRKMHGRIDVAKS